MKRRSAPFRLRLPFHCEIHGQPVVARPFARAPYNPFTVKGFMIRRVATRVVSILPLYRVGDARATPECETSTRFTQGGVDERPIARAPCSWMVANCVALLF
jgi:hypothetical protein